jgi:hypothetical protein
MGHILKLAAESLVYYHRLSDDDDLIPSIYFGGMWTIGSRLREEGAASGQREGLF